MLRTPSACALTLAALPAIASAQSGVGFTFDGCQGQGVWTSDGATYLAGNSLPTFAQGFDLLDDAFCSGSPFAAEPPVLVRRGGNIGADLRFSLSGRPNEVFVLVPSFNNGPTPIDLSNPGAPLIANVGLELFLFWEVGTLDPTGQGAVTIPLPNNPNVVFQTLQAQFLGISPTSFQADQLSNRVAVRLHDTGRPVPTSTVELSALGRHRATALADGRVLLSGGSSSNLESNLNATSDRLELYDVEKEAFYPANGALTQPRIEHTATLLDDGRVLIVGGFNLIGDPLDTAEIFDPATGLSTPTQDLPAVRARHSATRLGDGRVLVVGGLSFFDPAFGILPGAISPQTYLFDPAAGQWSNGPLLPDATTGCGLSTLPDGDALITGGLIFDDPGSGLTTITTDLCYRFDTANDQLIPEPDLDTASTRHGQLTLDDGRVLIVGGLDVFGTSETILRRTELWSSQSGFTATGDLVIGRYAPELAQTSDASLIVGAGLNNGLGVATLERSVTGGDFWFSLGNSLLPRPRGTLTPVEGSERVLITGNAGGASNAAAELLRP
ncbi:MAG: kelch repeat-containing protein [Planctomycetota bacterium]